MRGSAMQYVGGYILRTLWKNIERSKQKLLEEMVLALYGFLEDSEQCDPATGDYDVRDSQNSRVGHPDW